MARTNLHWSSSIREESLVFDMVLHSHTPLLQWHRKAGAQSWALDLSYQGAASLSCEPAKQAPTDVCKAARKPLTRSSKNSHGFNIYLTGFSGSGKTTIGKQVAAMTGWTYRDTDDEIVAATGRAIEDIFRHDGEVAFRTLEHSVLESVSQGERQVVSTGGGIVVDEENRRTMASTGIIVCLEARADTIYREFGPSERSRRGEAVRPLLQDPALGRSSARKARETTLYA